MRFQYSTHTHLNPVSQPFISRFYVNVVDGYESPKTLTTDSYPTPDSGTGTHPGRHLYYVALPCRESHGQSVSAVSFYHYIVPPPAAA